jgi:hypothetical protein
VHRQEHRAIGRADTLAQIQHPQTGIGALVIHSDLISRSAILLYYDAPVKHAGTAAFAALSDLLQSLRTRTALVERRPGIFYVCGKAFLHFHEDHAGLFADLRLGGDWQRFPVNSLDERVELVAVIDRIRFRR